MGIPSMSMSRNSIQSRSKSFVPYLAVLVFAAIFVFKVDILISQTIYAARLNVIGRPKSVVVQHLTTQDSTLNGTFYRHFILSWGEDKVKILEDGELLLLGLDKSSGSGFQGRKEYLFCKIEMHIKLVPGNSAGTVTTYYLSSIGSAHDEIDFEFLGNSTGLPYTLHTNVFSRGKGEREVQFFLWFDPTTDFHNYTILWNPKNIIFYVDGLPIREFKNRESMGIPYPKSQPMRLYSSLWNADDWATQGGRVKTNWTLAPFISSYKNFSAIQACVWSRFTYTSSCESNANSSNPSRLPWFNQELDNRSRMKMKRLQKKYMTYNYCKDHWRFPKGPAPECKLH